MKRYHHHSILTKDSCAKRKASFPAPNHARHRRERMRKYTRTRDEPRCKKAVLKTCGTMLHHTDRLFRMTIQNISVEATIERVKTLIAEEKELSPALKSSLEVLLLLVTLIVNRLGLHSKNSASRRRWIPIAGRSPEGKGGGTPGGQQGGCGPM